MDLTKGIPKWLTCFYLPGKTPEDFPVPLPIGSFTFVVKFDEHIHARVLTDSTLVVIHPDFVVGDDFPEAVGVLAYVGSLEKKGDYLNMEVELISRVIVITKIQFDLHNVPTVRWRPFEEVGIDEELFKTPEFQKQIERLRLLSVMFFVRNPLLLREIQIPPHRHSHETIGRYIDEVVFRLNVHVDRMLFELITILSEYDIEQRLYKAIEIYEKVLSGRLDWEKEERAKELPEPVPLSRSELGRKLLLSPSGKTKSDLGKETPCDSGISDRAYLGRLLLTGKRPSKGGGL